MSNTVDTNATVKLVKIKPGKDAPKETNERTFPLNHAKALLAIKNSQWKVADDSGYKYEGGELIKADKK